MKNILLTFLCTVSTAFSHAQTGQEIPFANTIKIDKNDSKEEVIEKAAHVVPNARQLDALRDGYIAFVHFGPNTFTKREWGTGMEDPKVFDLQNLDTDQWCSAMKAGGMKKVILTVKHHDGFVLWQSRYTEHGIMSSPYKNGKGDILKDLAKSCEKYGLKLGIYLSPADLFQIENPEGLYGNLSEYTQRTIPRPAEGRPFKNKTTFSFKVDDYNEYFLNQLFELLTEYGPIYEVWFDGATPKTKGGQKYNYRAWKKLIHTLAPEAAIFGKEDLRWVGNESGNTRDTEWNVIPYKANPDTLQMFGDLTADSLGTREQLYKANYLHYQPAEVNTSIREGWFYRDEDNQKVRTAGDVFDIYERALGGNSIFLLNIPPNRQGLFSDEDVSVLKEVGERIDETYGTDLFKNAKADKELLDDDPETVVSLDTDTPSLEIQTKKPITINRLIIQEAVATHSERIEEHSLEAMIEGKWQKVAQATNVGFKRILRFPGVTSDRFRIKVLKSRSTPVISKISAHYYKKRPPQLEIARSADGMVTIETKKDEFGWKRDMSTVPASAKVKILYGTGNAEPSQTYNGPFLLKSGSVKAMAVQEDVTGSATSKTFGMLKNNWEITADGFSDENRPERAIDSDPDTFWVSGSKDSLRYLQVDFGETKELNAFRYTPKASEKTAMIEKGTIKTSDDGKNWKTAETFEFGNLINDPTPRTHYFKNPIKTRYIKIEADRIAGNGKEAAAAEIDFL